MTTLPPQEDQAIAHGYAAIVRKTPSGVWSGDDRTALANRKSDNFELNEAIQVVLAAADEQHRSRLQEQIAEGDLAALEAFGDVRDLDSDTVMRLVARLDENIMQEVANLKRGQSSVRTISYGGTLVLINCWIPLKRTGNPYSNY